MSAGHPWVYRDAIHDGGFPAGAEVTLLDRRGRFLARGLADDGAIALRVWTLEDRPLDTTLLTQRLQAAVSLRKRVVDDKTDCFRLLHGEGDQTPGVVCDVYGRHAVLKLDGPSAEGLTGPLADAVEGLGYGSISLRRGRGPKKTTTLLKGTAPPEEIVVREHGMRLLVDVRRGQKTGLFLDHRESRRMVRSVCPGARVLNLYGYTGGFSVAAGLGGAAAVDTVDVAEPALEFARRSWDLNELPPVHRTVAEDVPTFLAERRLPYDVVIADPPSFAPHKHALRNALRSYEKLHSACLTQVKAGGFYLAASCSSHVRREAFAESLREGARRARAHVQVLGEWGAPADHPRLAAFPEGDYLKVVLLRRLS